jgi:eukaryotic-like serine/threonine-protein kinase
MHDDPTLPLGDSPSPAAGVPALRDEWGPFKLLARVGSGGFGEVYRAWDPNLEREVALKLLLPGAVGGDEEYKAMLREARAMASVQHPNIVHVYGIDRHDGRVGFWTDFVKGKTLSALLGAQGPFGYREAALIGIDVSRALSAVHRAGLLHRDIKAENVMREEGGRILLMDFGLSAGERSLGKQIAGTPNYMAPELFEGGAATVCTDIYAVGVLLYYLVIAEYPARLTGMTASEARAALANRTPLIDLRSDLPESFLRTVRTAMDLDPHKRFSSAGQLAESLAESMGTGAVTPSPAVPWSPAPPVPPPPPPPPPPPAAPPTWKNLFGLVAWFIGLPRKTKWIVLAIVIIFGERIFKSPTTIKVPKPPSVPSASADSSDSDDEDYSKAASFLQKPYRDSNVAEAVKGFQEILKNDPNSALAQAALGSAYFTQYRSSHDAKLLDMAKAATKRALELDKDQKLAEPHVTLARIDAAEGQTSLAMEQAQKAMALEPRSAEAYGALAQVYQAEGRKDDAITAVQRAIDLAPDQALWPLRLGGYYFDAGDLKNAAAQWQKSADLDDDNALAYLNLGLVNVQLDKLSDAHDDFEKVIDIQPTASAYNALGMVLMLEAKYSDAVKMNQKAVDIDPQSYESEADLASSYQWSNQHDKAMQAYAKAIALGEAQRTKTPDDALLLVQLADFYASSGKSDLSLLRLRKGLALAPDDPNIQYRAGETYEILGQRGKAIQLIAQAIAQGYHANELQRSPELASLRVDPAFVTALTQAKIEAALKKKK